MLNKKYRIRSSVALSYNNGKMEFFKTNTREIVILQMQNVIDFLKQFNGERTLYEISCNSLFNEKSLEKFIKFLHDRNILIEVDSNYNAYLYSSKYRLINFLEDYCFSTSEVLQVLENLALKSVLIVGLGGVGSWVADILARSGVGSFILIDSDKVELSNLHRQDFYIEKDIGRFKIDCVEERLLEIADIKVKKYYQILNETFFENFNEDFCLAINCADFPSVDKTTEIIGKECMRRRIPHVIGGGYNLHLSLIGQSILPYESACYNCFDEALKEINDIQENTIKKLVRKDRKVGSFTPLCSLSASLTAIEAFKLLCGFNNKLTNTNHRIEFKIKTMDIERKMIPKNPKCKVCGN